MVKCSNVNMNSVVVVVVVFMFVVLVIDIVFVKEYIVGGIIGWDYVFMMFFYFEWFNKFRIVFGDKIGMVF